ncbi:type II secretion system GspH family protein [Niveibacterium sp. 24ML]|uniref:type II secretion system protein n=1 Tax=Niveibacterium sp. 24ML TaxID=2985512 RepID=UPI00227104F1|nr:type II secretion system protein [Niveibacterium sp. 24ML]MCX9155077.1 type II secretion system GspH family protein [Niveibacterium sp. 24ML]
MPSPEFRRSCGFTLIEMVLVITIVGILAATAAVFIQRPMEAIFDTADRAALSDSAETAMRRLGREIRSALPNSLRVTSTGSGATARYYIEFLPVLGGGRYCAAPDAGGVCSSMAGSISNPLTFDLADSSFEVIGPVVQPTTGTLAYVAVYNLGTPGADAWAGDTLAAFGSLTGGGARTVTLAAPKLFPFASPGNRFHLVGAPVSYECAPQTAGTSGTGTLRRYWGYALSAAQPTSFASANSALVADRVAACRVDYTQTAIEQNGLISLTLGLQQKAETVTLTHEVVVNNVP